LWDALALPARWRYRHIPGRCWAAACWMGLLLEARQKLQHGHGRQGRA
jgi:hypothetical protein